MIIASDRRPLFITNSLNQDAFLSWTVGARFNRAPLVRFDITQYIFQLTLFARHSAAVRFAPSCSNTCIEFNRLQAILERLIDEADVVGPSHPFPVEHH